MQEIIEGQFFWGIIVGLLLSFVGGWVQAKFTVSQTEKQQKRLFVRFCIDTIRNVQKIINAMDEVRDKSKTIHPDYLALIDAEFGVYGRNREHIILLPEATRDKVREFMTNCVVKKVEIASKLQDFNRLWDMASQAQAAGRSKEASQLRNDSQIPLNAAHAAADRLVTIAKGATELINDLNKL